MREAEGPRRSPAVSTAHTWGYKGTGPDAEQDGRRAVTLDAG